MPKATKNTTTSSYRYDPIAGPSNFAERLVRATVDETLARDSSASNFPDQPVRTTVDEHFDLESGDESNESIDEDEEHEEQEHDDDDDDEDGVQDDDPWAEEMWDASDILSDSEASDSEASEPRPATSLSKGYLFRVSMMTMSPPRVSRIIRVPAHLTFLQLHAVLQAAFSWGNCHAWKFDLSECTSARGRCTPICELVAPQWVDNDISLSKQESAADWKLSDVYENPKYEGKGILTTYTYDFGDQWEHFISFMGIADDHLAMTFGMTHQPELFLVSGEGAPAIEDCGGHYGHEQLKRLFANPRLADPEGRRQWVGLQKWDPWNWDIEEVNQRLLDLAADDYDLYADLEEVSQSD